MPRLFAIEDGEAVELIVCGIAPFAKKTVQNCGQAFFDKFEKSSSSSDQEGEESPGKSRQDKDSSDDADSPSKGPKKKKEKKERSDHLKLPDCLKGEDLYELLDTDTSAGEDVLKKAYRKVCLTHHPDKHNGKSEEEMEAVNLYFVKLQEAFNILSDVKKRRKYDSMGEFNDSVPTKLKEGQDFYEVFDAVFKRNAKWSEYKPVPELGNADTPYDKVKKFYEFWFAFDSWRDLDEAILEAEGEDCFQNIEDAECRDERRWMEKENARIRGKYLKAERQRIFGFVELAEKLDPRVKAEKDQQWAEREAAKAAKEAKQLEVETKAREEEVRKAVAKKKEEVAQAVEKAKRQKENEAKKAARAKLRKVVKALNLGLAEDPLQEFFLSLDSAETDKLTAELAGGGKGEAVFAAMKAKGVEPIIVQMEEEKSTTEGSPSEEEKLSPEEQAKLEKERVKRQKDNERKQKKVDAENAIIRAEEEKVRAEEKKVRDAKKAVENEKRDKEQQKQNKKEADKLKRDEEKKVKDEEKKVETAKKEKENNSKRAEEQRQKNKAENEAENEAKALEVKTFEFERDRLARCEELDRTGALATGIADAALASIANPILASGLASANALPGYEDPEELLDAQLACLGKFFALGIRPAEDALPLSSGLRSKVKKARNRIRLAAAAGEFVLEAPAGTVADEKVLDQLLLAAVCEAPCPAAEAAAAAAPAPAVAEEPAAGKGKKKAKAKAAPADEDLDALLEEFGMTGGEKKGKKKGKK